MSVSLASGTFARAGHRGSRPSVARPGFFTRLWSGLQWFGMLRAAPHLERMAQQVGASDPALARRLREAARGLHLDDRG